MGIFNKLIFKNESSNMSNAGRWLADMLGTGFGSYTGKEVSVKSAMTNGAVNAAVRLIAETIASVPLHVYERIGETGKKRARGHPLYKILHSQPNSEMTAFSFWEIVMFWLLLGHGNFYAEIERSLGGKILALWPLIPSNMQINRVQNEKTGNWEISYLYTLPNGGKHTFNNSEIFHLHGIGSNGIIGFTPLQMAAQAIGLSLGAEEFGARFFGNGGNVNGVLESELELGDDGRQNLRESFDETYGGLSRAHRLLILEQGVKYKQTGIPPDQAQFLETRRFQVTDIARFFRVPPHMIYDLERSTNNNIEQQSLEFVQYTLLPWVIRIEQTIFWKLLTEKEQEQIFAEFDLDGLLRGDMKSRYESYHIARLDGWITADQIRAKENMNPLTPEELAQTWRPVNMVPGDTTIEMQTAHAANQPAGGGDTKK